MEFEKIKLIIWDLDNTFWQGTITEGAIQPVEKNSELIKNLTDGGIINSICSKNTFDLAAGKLKELEVFDYFVFPSIDWTPKGQRVRALVKSMGLRPENTLFIDDEPTNLEEVKHYSPGIMTGLPVVLPELYALAGAMEKKDLSHTRLEQYKLLEKKAEEQQKYDSNEEFLYASNIRVDLDENCKPEAERIHELIMRSNQLNYTKKRSSLEELNALLDNKDARCGTVSVQDKFGNYGIIGFYALLNNRLEHFLFSCRTIGLGVEQYVYSQLNCPPFDLEGEVISMVTKAAAPPWINHAPLPSEEAVDTSILKVINQPANYLIKASCDFSKAIGYIKNSDAFTTEFNYVSRTGGQVVEGHHNTVQILGLKEYSPAQQQEILQDCRFFDEEMLKGTIFNTRYDVVFLSTLSESYAGIYRKKGTDILVTVGSYLYPFTDRNCWEGLINGSYYSSNNKLTVEYLKEFSEKYEFLGKTTPEAYIKRLNKILGYLHPETRLCLILGVEFPCVANKDYVYHNRNILHTQLNNAIRELARTNPQVVLLDLNDLVKHQSDFTDNLNQFSSRVYYEISQKMIAVINESARTKIQNYSTLFVYFDMLLNYTKVITKRIMPKDVRVRRNLQNIYHMLSRRKKQ